MYVHVNNENYGYDTATHDDWVIVGSPSSFRYNSESSSFWRTGSVDIFKYNTLTDQHDLLLTLYRGTYGPYQAYLADESGSSTNPELIYSDTIKSFVIPYSTFLGWQQHIINWSNAPIQIDSSEYINTFEDDYGHSVDVYNNIMAVGCRWWNHRIDISNTSTVNTGSSVDIFNLTSLHSNPFDGYISTGSGFFVGTIRPPSGESVSGSFGYSVSVNDEWLAVSSPLLNDTGSVHMYRRTTPASRDNIRFTYFSTLTGSVSIESDLFGSSIDLNKQTGSYSGSIIIGCGRNTSSSSFAYYFEFDGVNWTEQNIFSHDLTPRNLSFCDVIPVLRDPVNVADGYGNSVALWENDIAIGAPIDRIVYEYSGSSLYNQGSAYLYRKCSDNTRGWYLVDKTYGNEKILKNNKFGFSLDMWGDYLAIGSPKFNYNLLTSCYEEGAVWQSNYCNNNTQDYVQGQWVLYKKNTESSSFKWDIQNVYQKKKRFLEPYRAFGFDTAISNKSVVIGSPMLLYDTNRNITIQNTGSIQENTVLPLKDYTGKSYIYNLDDFRNSFHVGNVFYRNGKIVLNTSGSIFDGLWFNPITKDNYEYEVGFDSKQTLYEKQINCVIEPGEFNFSTNPTAIIRELATFDINKNGYFDWQDMDVILRYMQRLNTRYTSTPTLDWSSSLLKNVDEVSYFNFNSSNNSYYNTGDDFISQSFFNILDTIGNSQFDFNQDSKIDLNDMNIFWKYNSNRLNQINYSEYITPNSQRRLFSDITDHLNDQTKRNALSSIKPEFLTFTSQSKSDMTGSYLSPYCTSVGLFSGLDLICVAKLGSPLKLTGDFPLNICIKLDF